jgi:predicted Zn-dependent protease with MMP-like domain
MIFSENRRPLFGIMPSGMGLDRSPASPKTPTMTDDPLADPLAWRRVAAPSLVALEVLAAEAFRRLPSKFRILCEGLVIQVEDFPTDEVLDAMHLDSEFDLLGLFQGTGLPFRSESAPAQMPNMIWLYRRPILDYWAEHEETLGAIVTHVLVHEIGHHFGLSDDDMHAIEQEAG